MPILPVDPELHLIDLDQPLPGQRRFISCWVSVSEDVVFLVDPGPPGTAAHLLEKLANLNLPRLDFILLTHVHLDHGGATAEILKYYPQAKVICQPKGRAHLMDPSRLWEGSLQVLGHKAEVYGEPEPVKPESVVSYEALEPFGIEIIPTPGHAPHHICYRHGSTLYLGEAAGTFSSLCHGPEVTEYYLRPATPPRFYPQVALASIDRLIAISDKCERLVFAHHGSYNGNARELLMQARQQMELWLVVAGEMLSQSPWDSSTASEEQWQQLREKTAQNLLERDSIYARRGQLPADIQIREQDFTNQTLRGIFGHLTNG